MVFESGPVIVPLDGSDVSERALPCARALVGAFNTRLVLLTAIFIPELPGGATPEELGIPDPIDVCQGYLENLRGTLAYANTDVMVESGYPHEAILQAIADTDPALMVISTHGRSGLSRWSYGSTASHLVHASRIPLLVIGKGVPAVVPGTFTPKHILVPLDGSPFAEKAIPAATEIARVFGARICAVTVAPLAAAAVPSFMGSTIAWPDLDPQLQASANSYLSRVGEALGASAETTVLRGDAADALLAYVEDRAVDRVVMTTHARKGIARSLLGSTADRMLHGRAPILLIRPESA
jgi:nucleotide-binding universal stress UspA family protein